MKAESKKPVFIPLCQHHFVADQAAAVLRKNLSPRSALSSLNQLHKHSPARNHEVSED